MMLSVFLSLMLMQLIVHVTSTLLSVQVTSYKNLRNETNGPVLCALDLVNKTMSSSSLEECSLNCIRDDTCIGFNIKNSLTCDHVMTPVLALTSRTHSPVITWWHLYWLQHQELTHLWSRDDTCIGFNIKNSLTCDHVMTPVLASTSRTHSPVICTIIIPDSLHLSQTACSTRLNTV